MRECDLILQGGITSGVVYPGAIARLAEHYRFRSLGGTSAGAIGAVLAAAAEYRRQRALGGSDEEAMAGFVMLASLGRELGSDLRTLFQPAHGLRRLYDMLLVVATRANSESVVWTIARALWAGFGLLLPLAALPGLLLLLIGDSTDVTDLLLGVLLSVLIPAALVFEHTRRALFRLLPENNYGLCSGLSVEHRGRTPQPAFTNWIHTHIEAVARPRNSAREGNDPLTIGDLQPYKIAVAGMTTDLSSRRPWQLPLRTGVHAFIPSEFRRLFPEEVVGFLEKKGGSVDPDRADPDDFHYLPGGSDMPLVVLARLSLSFPCLVSAVPLYRQESGGSKAGGTWHRCVFSDGGISSNFPVHFFDSILPSRPTFGIGFAPVDPQNKEDRVSLPSGPPDASGGRIMPFAGLPGFLGAIVNTAKDWQDTLQRRLSGYAERIVEIRLDPESEGGLHVDMEEKTIDELFQLGDSAAQRLASEFDFDEHRYRRALATLPKIDSSLSTLAENYGKRDGSCNNLGYDEVLKNHQSPCFPNDPAWRMNPLRRFALDLVRIGENSRKIEACHSRNNPEVRYRFADGNLPAQDTELRIVASPD